MTQHYYTDKPEAESRPRMIETTLRGYKLAFMTDSGVFSKGGIDFGSRLLIETMRFRADAEVLDAGCGYGPIGLTAAKLAPRGRVTMIDINERAIRLSSENAHRNGVDNVRILQSDLLQEVLDQRFDCVLTNPPIRAGKETVHRLFEQARECLREGGDLWVVIQKKQGAPSAFAKLETLFSSVEEICKDKGYRILRASL